MKTITDINMFVKELIDFIKPIYNKHDGHDAEHAIRVANLALNGYRFSIHNHNDTADALVIFIAGLFHDIHDKTESDVDIYEWLKQYGIEDMDEIIERIKFAISMHSFTAQLKYIKNNPGSLKIPLSDIPAMYLSDADKIDATGIIGFMRSIRYSTTIGKKTFSDKEIPVNLITYDEYLIDKKNNGLDSSIIEHMFNKIVHLPQFMYTPWGEALINERLDTLLSVLEILAYEANDIYLREAVQKIEEKRKCETLRVIQ